MVKINFNGQEKKLSEIVEELQIIGFDIKLSSLKTIMSRKKDSFTYKFLEFEKIFNKWYCKIRS